MFDMSVLCCTHVIWQKFSIFKVWLFLLLNHFISYIISLNFSFVVIYVFISRLIIQISCSKLEISLFEIRRILKTIVSSLSYFCFRQDQWIKGISTATLKSLRGSTICNSFFSNAKIVFPCIFDHFKSLNLIITVP